MDFAGSVEIAAARRVVWDFLVDLEALAACGPGVESVEPIDDRHARITARVGLGFIAARFTIDLERGETEPPHRAAVRGVGETPGSQVEGLAEMRLSGPPEGPTRVDWTAGVEIYGTLAGVGARLVETGAGRLIDEAFECVRARLTEQGSQARAGRDA